MLIQNITCPHCRDIIDADDDYCGGCGTSLTVQRAQPPVRYNDNQAMTNPTTFQDFDSMASDLEIWRNQAMQGKDRLKQGSLLWLLGGRFLHRRELNKQMEKMFAQAQAIRQAAVLRGHVQQANYLLRRQQLGYDIELEYDRFLFEQKLKDEAVERCFIRLARVVDKINELFVEGGRFVGLPPEIQQEVALRYLHQAERLCLEMNQLLDDGDDSLDFLEENF